ncbi:MAG: hypothetical protein MI924_07335 [Chloroflexales bacterium]|nr:hypothetical protein [Chloroflexales bacterium]
MNTKRVFLASCLFGCALLGLLLVIGATQATAAASTRLSATAAETFVEPNIVLIHTLNGEAPNAADSFGWVGASIGDLDQDGANEFIISAPTYSATVANQGRVYLYSGRTGAALHTITGEAGGQLGYSVVAAGDINKDNVPDYIVSSPGGAGVLGRVQVYSGADNSELYNLSSNPGFFGADIDGGTDVNGDTYPDIIVGAQFETTTLTRTGRVYLYSGQNGGVLWTRDGLNEGDLLGAGVGFVDDVNADSVPDIVAAANGADSGNGRAYVLSGSDGVIIHTLAPTEPFSNTNAFGRFFALGAGDINNDGTSDIFIGDYATLNGNGRVYLYSGVDGSLLRVIEAEAPGDGLGPGRGIGDVNSDGFGDLIIASYTFGGAASSGGKAYIYSGADGNILNSITSKVANLFLGVDALSLGDVNGDGAPDYLVTGFGSAYVVSFNSMVYLPVLFR